LDAPLSAQRPTHAHPLPRRHYAPKKEYDHTPRTPVHHRHHHARHPDHRTRPRPLHGLSIETREPEEAVRDLTQLARRESWRLGIWDCDAGLAFPWKNTPPASPTDTNDPLAVLRSAGQLSQGAATTLLVLQNFHRFLGSTEILQAVQKQVSAGKHTRTFVVILAPVVNLPPGDREGTRRGHFIGPSRFWRDSPRVRLTAHVAE